MIYFFFKTNSVFYFAKNKSLADIDIQQDFYF